MNLPSPYTKNWWTFDELSARWEVARTQLVRLRRQGELRCLPAGRRTHRVSGAEVARVERASGIEWPESAAAAQIEDAEVGHV